MMPPPELVRQVLLADYATFRLFYSTNNDNAVLLLLGDHDIWTGSGGSG